MTAQGGIITTEFLELMKGETVNNPSIKPQAFVTFNHPAPENQKKLDENISGSFYNLVERWDSISNFYENMDISDARGKWIIPLLRELGFDPGFNREDIIVDRDENLKFRLSYRGWISPKAPMVHTVIPGQDLEAKSIGGTNNKRSPHDEMQKFLNVSKDHKWGVVTNGISFRILRDFFHTTTKGYVEFDVENIMRERSYSDFRAFYRMAHASRFRRNGDNGNYPLELFYKQSVTAGVKVGQNLKNNVKKAIEVFGNGFLTPELTRQMIDDEKFCREYYSEILRVIYRLLFLLYAEQRAMLPTRNSLFIDEYSITRLREISEKYKGKDDHYDLWEGLMVTFRMLAQGCEPLRVFPYNGSLFDNSDIPTIKDQKITNYDLLEAIRCLTLVEEGHVLKRINYLDLGVEEIGSIYENLLDYTPRVLSSPIEIDGTIVPGNRFFLDPRGSARKTTGSYYTDKRLVDELIKSALKPVAEKKMEECDDKETAILSLKVCDPACGSGAFLIAATEYLGKELAKIRTDQSEPPDEDIQRAKRDVLQRCIYGVDINPMVVELAKVSLWIDAAVSDLPLNFLDHHIKCGNSLIGTTAELIEKGIPDEAFSPLEGDDKQFAKEIKNKNKMEKEQQVLKEFERKKGPTWAEELGKMSNIEENDIDSVKWKQKCYNAIVDSSGRQHEKLVVDAWCAAFFWELNEDAPSPPTEAMLRMMQKDTGYSLDLSTESMIHELADEYRFFHWHLEFPDIFESEEGGFDCVLGNPPWERVKLQEKEFFEYRDEEIANAQNKSKREKLIKKLQYNMSLLYMEFKKAYRDRNAISNFLRDSRRFELTAKGDINYYPIFAELNKTIINSYGRVGMVIASGIATDFYTQDFFQNIITGEQLVSLYDFENREGIFPGIHRSYKFTILTLTGKKMPVREADFTFYLVNPNHLQEEERHFTLTNEEIELLNPNTRTCPIFRSKKDDELTKKIYRKHPVLIKQNSNGEDENPWGIKFSTMFHMSNDSHLFKNEDELINMGFELDGNIFHMREETYLPLYEGKMIWFYDHRFAEFSPDAKGYGTVEASIEQHQDPDWEPMPRYWVRKEEVNNRTGNDVKWLLGFRGITNTTNEKTAIFSIFPSYAIGNSLPIIPTINDANMASLFIAISSSFVFDYISRQKIAGMNLNFHFVEQFPMPDPIDLKRYSLNNSEKLYEIISKKVLNLLYTSHSLTPFARDLGYDGPPFSWDPDERSHLMAELDAIVAHLYGVTYDELDYILETFPIVKKKDIAESGEYKTKRLILENYNKYMDIMEASK
jgi:hypothetical protein